MIGIFKKTLTVECLTLGGRSMSTDKISPFKAKRLANKFREMGLGNYKNRTLIYRLTNSLDQPLRLDKGRQVLVPLTGPTL